MRTDIASYDILKASICICNVDDGAGSGAGSLKSSVKLGSHTSTFTIPVRTYKTARPFYVMRAYFRNHQTAPVQQAILVRKHAQVINSYELGYVGCDFIVIPGLVQVRYTFAADSIVTVSYGYGTYGQIVQ